MNLIETYVHWSCWAEHILLHRQLLYKHIYLHLSLTWQRWAILLLVLISSMNWLFVRDLLCYLILHNYDSPAQLRFTCSAYYDSKQDRVFVMLCLSEMYPEWCSYHRHCSFLLGVWWIGFQFLFQPQWFFWCHYWQYSSPWWFARCSWRVATMLQLGKDVFNIDSIIFWKCTHSHHWVGVI